MTVKEINGLYIDTNPGSAPLKSLKTVHLPDTIKKLHGFYNFESLENINLPEGLTVLESNCFSDCINLKQITLPSTLKTIGYRCFEGCTALDAKSVIIPESVTSIQVDSLTVTDGDNVYGYKIDEGSNDLYVVIINYTGSGSDWIVPSTLNGIPVKKIDIDYYYHKPDFSTIKNLVVPDGVTTIQSLKFQQPLNSIKLPNSIESISNSNLIMNFGDYVCEFTSDKNDNLCAVLTQYNADDDKPVIPTSVNGIKVTSLAKNLFESKNLSSVTIPDTITSIGVQAFGGCNNLTEIIIPDSVTYIGPDAFRYSGLKKAVLSKNINTINEETFYHCFELSDVVIPDGVYAIYEEAFERCESLTKINIPSSVTYIGDRAFYKSGITDKTLPDTVGYVGDDIFEDESNDGKPKVKIPEGCKLYGDFAYRTFDNEKTGKTEIEIARYYGDSMEVVIPEKINGLTVTSIASETFSYYAEYDSESRTYNGKITNVVLPDTISSIGNNNFEYGSKKSAFYGCSLIDNGFKYEYIIDPYSGSIAAAIIGAEEVDTLNIPSEINGYRVTAIGGFGKGEMGSKKNSSELIPYGYVHMSEAPPVCNETLKHVNIPDTVNTICKYAFLNCVNLEEITISKSVRKIEIAAFYGCNSIKEIYLPETVTELVNYTAEYDKEELILEFCSPFGSCNSLEKLTVDPNNPNFCSVDGVLFIKDMKTMIQYPTGKKDKSYAIPNGVENLLGLSGKYVNNHIIDYITEGAFSYNTYIEDVTIPESLEVIESGAFYGCLSITSMFIPNTVKEIQPGAFSRMIMCGIVNIYTAASYDFNACQHLVLYGEYTPAIRDYLKSGANAEFIPIELLEDKSNPNPDKDTDTDNKDDTDNKKDTIIIGDMDGDNTVTSADSLTILRASVQLETLTKAQEKAADVNGNGAIDSADSLAVLRFSVKLVDIDTIGKRIKVS